MRRRLARRFVGALVIAVLLVATVAATSASAAVGGPYFAWGQGLLGDGGDAGSTSPEAINLAPGVSPTALASSSGGNLAIGSNGKLYSWGYYLGNGGTTSSLSPTPITLGSGVSPTAISGGVTHDSAIGSDHQLYSWGSRDYGAVGDNSELGEQLTPEMITLAPGVTPTAISGSWDLSLAIGSNGQLYGWGEEGIFAETPVLSPQPIHVNAGTPEEPVEGGPFAANAISTGCQYSLAIGSDGELYTWGTNTSGQLGNGIGGDAHQGSELLPNRDQPCSWRDACVHLRRMYHVGRDRLRRQAIRLGRG